MNFHKIISRTVLATALLGATFGGVLSINTHVNASQQDPSNPNGSLNSLSRQGQSASTSSKATVNLSNGYLSLDNVPNLNFGNNKDTSTNNNLTLSSNGLLRVTDYRNNSQNDQSNKDNWELDVSMDPFKNSDNNTTDKNWQMTLNSGQAISGSHNSEGNSIPVPTSSTFNDDNSSTQIMSTKYTTNDGYGTNSINYNNDDAILNVPSVKPNTYTSNMTWTLSANMNSSSNNNNSGTNDAYSNANNTDPNASAQ